MKLPQPLRQGDGTHLEVTHDLHTHGKAPSQLSHAATAGVAVFLPLGIRIMKRPLFPSHEALAPGKADPLLLPSRDLLHKADIPGRKKLRAVIHRHLDS